MTRELNKIIKDLNKITEFTGNISFNFEEQELIRRVFKSIFKQIEGFRDIETAKTILNKTEWIDGS